MNKYLIRSSRPLYCEARERGREMPVNAAGKVAVAYRKCGPGAIVG